MAINTPLLTGSGTPLPTEHRLTLVGGGSVLVNKAPGKPVVLQIAERSVGFQAIDLSDEEVDILVHMLKRTD